MDSTSTSSLTSTLVLVPTRMELDLIHLLRDLHARGAVTCLSGIGPVAAAARAAERLATLAPTRVVLVGIAGTYDPERIPVGSALAFDEVAIEGVGAGIGASARGLEAIGLPHWIEDRDGAPRSIGDRLQLVNPALDSRERPAAMPRERALLVTVCSASSTSADAALRRERFPGASAEDMEGFAVALACTIVRVPLTIVRGISNVAGDREHRRWRIADAMASASELMLSVLDARAPA